MTIDDTLRDDFNRRVDGSVSRLIESYRVLLKGGTVDKSHAPSVHMQFSATAANVALHAHALLDQVNELRLEHTTTR